jgi:mannose-6-phosphate isomerase-like protein (cupin superfamily)
MKVVRIGEGSFYDAPGHFNCSCMNKLFSGQDTKRTTIAVSHFLPDGGATMSSSPKERVYVVLTGRIQVSGKDEEHILEARHMIYIAPNEERAFKVMGSEPASILVILTNVD